MKISLYEREQIETLVANLYIEISELIPNNKQIDVEVIIRKSETRDQIISIEAQRGKVLVIKTE